MGWNGQGEFEKREERNMYKKVMDEVREGKGRKV